MKQKCLLARAFLRSRQYMRYAQAYKGEAERLASQGFYAYIIPYFCEFFNRCSKMNTTPIILPDVRPFQQYSSGWYVYPRKVFSSLKSQRKPLYNGQNTPHIRPLWRDIDRRKIESGNMNTTPIISQSATADQLLDLVRGVFLFANKFTP